ncbi:MAG: hypothetical protein LUG89_00665 [Methanosphaera sp.]|nr:hypothetical protein [Methanosphaera sp.]
MAYFKIFPQATTIIAETDTGSITKTVYNNNSNSNITIILITGIHPRETLSIEPEQEALEEFASENNVRCINYDVDVTKNPDDYSEGRSNGEHLIADYILPDIYEDNLASVVIISHSHIEGYGEGYYVATPAMDEASVTIAEKINTYGEDFGYYPSNVTTSYNSTSAQLVSRPLANAGYPTLVYEIPENITTDDANEYTQDLLEIVYEILQGNL